MRSGKIKICRIVSIPFFFRNHLLSTIIATVDKGYDLHLVCSSGSDTQVLTEIEGVTVHEINIERGISIFKDLISLFLLFRLFKKENYRIIHSTTPKAGLLSAVAGFMMRVPLRYHTFTGQWWINKTGFSKELLKFCDWLIVKLNIRCYADSISQKELLVKEKIGSADRISVIGSGSLAGVNTELFNADKYNRKMKDRFRKELQIPDNAIVINFTGRINIDKGFVEYIEAFKELYTSNKDIYWLIVGPYEGLTANMLRFLTDHPNIRLTGYCPEPVLYYAISDIFCIPSYREGFGNVVIEAGLMGLPSVATDIVGLTDSVVDGETGLLVPVRDTASLIKALKKFIEDPDLRLEFGANARKRARSTFDKDVVNKLILDEYEDFLKEFRDR